MDLKALEGKLNPDNVKKNPKGYDYIEGWFAIAEANRIFGHDGWTRETLDLTENTTPTQNAKGNYVVSFRARVRIHVGDQYKDGIGFGSGIAKDIHDAYEGAIKEAETDAMKRALMTFGNPFGLALYDKKKEGVGVDLSPEEIKAQEEAEKQKAALKTKADKIRDQLKASENLDVLNYVWNGFKGDLDKIKEVSPTAYNTLEGAYKRLLEEKSQEPLKEAAE